MWRRWRGTPSALIGVAVAAAFCAALLFGEVLVRPLALTAADMLFIREGGPLLGARPAHPDIVLVLWDSKSVIEMDGAVKPSRLRRQVSQDQLFDLDLQLYSTLLAAGARVVADTDIVFGDDPGVRQLMDGMVATGAPGRLFRDFYPRGEPWYAERSALYDLHVGHNLLFESGSSAHDVTQYLRYYPLLGFNLDEGFYEAMALKVARITLGIPPPTNLGRLGQESGIAAIWSVQSGMMTEDQLPEAVREAGKNPRPYLLGADYGIPWILSPDIRNPEATAPAALWINFASPTSFPTVSYMDALRGRTPPGLFKDKVVLVGVDGIDTYQIPTSSTRRVPTAEVVAHATQTMVERRFLQPMSVGLAIAAVWVLSLASALVVGLLRPFASMAIMVGILTLYVAYATVLYRLGTFPDLVVAPGATLAAAVLVGGFRYGREEIARRRVYDMFGRYVPRAVVSELMQKPLREALAVGGVNRDITVLFADIRGFTAFSEKLPPEQVLSRLNALLEAMVQCVFRHEGTVDKYIGDAIMVIFNAPIDQADHVERAVRTALDMQQAMAGVEGDLGFGIGIHIGEAVVGTVGTPERMEYTAIGSTVNIASRLCDTARKGEVVVSREVYDRVAQQVVAEERLPVRVKNIERELVTYLVSAFKPET